MLIRGWHKQELNSRVLSGSIPSLLCFCTPTGTFCNRVLVLLWETILLEIVFLDGAKLQSYELNRTSYNGFESWEKDHLISRWWKLTHLRWFPEEFLSPQSLWAPWFQRYCSWKELLEDNNWPIPVYNIWICFRASPLPGSCNGSSLGVERGVMIALSFVLCSLFSPSHLPFLGGKHENPQLIRNDSSQHNLLIWGDQLGVC